MARDWKFFFEAEGEDRRSTAKREETKGARRLCFFRCCEGRCPATNDLFRTLYVGPDQVLSLRHDNDFPIGSGVANNLYFLYRLSFCLFSDRFFREWFFYWYKYNFFNLHTKTKAGGCFCVYTSSVSTLNDGNKTIHPFDLQLISDFFPLCNGKG